MGLILYLPLLTFFGLKLGHYLFLVAVRSLWHLFLLTRRTLSWVDRPSGRTSRITPTSSGGSSSSEQSSSMPAISAGQTASSPRHSLVQFLNTILSTRGPNSLPYTEDVKAYIRQHLLAMIKEFQSLQIKTGTFTHNDGCSSFLLQASGTIPMFYKDIEYNIPITMWLVECYPRVAPLVFVTPTRDMIIKAHHPCVDASGTVTVPYLRQWMFPRSNLVELVRSLSLVCGEDPPLYSRPAAASPQREAAVTQAAPSRASPQSSIHATNPLHSSPISGWTSTSSSQGSPSTSTQSPNRLNRPPPYTVDPSSPGSSSRITVKATTPEEAFQINAVNALTERLQKDSKAVLRRGEVDMDELFNTQVLLNERKERVDEGFRDMQQERESLEEQLQLYMTNTDVIEAWLRENEGEKSELSIDNVFHPVDDISRQLLESTAADLTIEDTLYSLDRAVQEGSVPWDAYHKAVRQLSREQFYQRATCLKLTAVHRHLQVESMASRASENSLEANA